MEFGSINLAVKDADVALDTYLKMFGTNNVKKVIKVTGLNDGIDIVDGYYLVMEPVKMGIFKPRESEGCMSKFLREYGGGIHHMEFHLPQDEFMERHEMFKSAGWAVSEKPVYIGKFSEAIFWLNEGGQQGVPVKFATKAHHGLGENEAIYLDTPRSFETIDISVEYPRPPGVVLDTVVIATSDLEASKVVWARLSGQPLPVTIKEYDTNVQARVNDGRGNIFLPVSFKFQEPTRINMYEALNEEGPIRKVMKRRGLNTMYHNIIIHVTRDRFHEYWGQLEDAGFSMVDPKPYLMKDTGNYFFFVHPKSLHGVVAEYVQLNRVNETTGHFSFDWTGSETHIVSPDVR
jgi:hypothetical protein